jgi:hypothetical protein
MKEYTTPELVKLGDALELTLGTRPGADFDQNGAEFDPYPPCCCSSCDDGGGCIVHQN